MSEAGDHALDCDKVTRLLSILVRIPTPNDPVRGVKPGMKEASAIASAIRGETGDEYQILEGPSPVLIRVVGSGRPVTLFLAHYDVVPPGPGWTVDPYSGLIREGALYGRGSADDKSNVAAISVALSGYRPPRGTIVAAFTGDEETGGRSAKWLASWLERESLWPDHLVNGDGVLERIIVRRRNAFSARITVRAGEEEARGEPVEREFETRFLVRKTMHSAYFVPSVDTHSLVAASLWARDNEVLVSELDGEWVKGNVIPRRASIRGVAPGGGGLHSYDPGLTSIVWSIVPLVRAPVEAELYSDYGVSINPNVYTLSGGEHTLHLDIRAMSMSRGRIEDALKSVLDATIGPGKYGLRVSGGGGYLYTDPDTGLIRTARGVARRLGLPDRLVEAAGASDSRHFSPRGVEAFDYGPLGYNIHGPDEHVIIDSLCRVTLFYRALAGALHE